MSDTEPTEPTDDEQQLDDAGEPTEEHDPIEVEGTEVDTDPEAT